MESKRADWLWLVALCFLGFLLGKWQNNARDRGSLDSLTRIVQALINPASTTLHGTAEAISDFSEGVLKARSLAAENQALKDKSRALEQYQRDFSSLSTQFDQLRKLIGLPRYGNRWRIPAEIIAYAPYEDRITLSVGSRKGVGVGLPVLTGDGLLAIVQVVEENSCQALLLSSRQTQVGAMAMRNPPQPGILRGESPDRLILGFLDTQTPIEVGDVVATSGFSTRIPRGIPIGKIVQVETNADFGARRAQVFPFARIGDSHEVFILR